MSIRRADRRMLTWERYLQRYPTLFFDSPGYTRAYRRWGHAYMRPGRREWERRLGAWPDVLRRAADWNPW